MSKEQQRKRKKLRLIPLIIGAYAAFLGFGLIVVGLSGGVVGWIWVLIGIIMGGFGLYGVWEGVRDLFEPEKEREEAPVQYVFTDIQGKKSSNVTKELLKKGLEALAESSSGSISLQVLPPLSVSGIGRLEQILCLHREEFWVLGCFLSKEGKPLVYQKNADLDLAEVVLEEILSGTADASWWADAEELEVRPEDPGEGMQLLTIYGESWRDEHKFFSARDLELTVEGLEEGRYVKVDYQLGLAVLSVRPDLSNASLLEVRMYFWEKGYPGRPRIFVRNGTAVQVKFWLVRIYNEGLQAEGEGWQEMTNQKA